MIGGEDELKENILHRTGIAGLGRGGKGRESVEGGGRERNSRSKVNVGGWWVV